MFIYLFKALRKIISRLVRPMYTPAAKILLYLNGVKYQKNLKVSGFLKIHVTRRGRFKIGENNSFNSGNYNLIGRQQTTIFWVEGELSIGDNVGISSSAIICNQKIWIGNNVTIGGNTVIYDSDFHSLDPKIRINKINDKLLASKKAVIIEDNVFIGSHSTILKGVVIGENSIIGACSVVTKNVPSNEIWAGNPAKYIKDVLY